MRQCRHRLATFFIGFTLSLFPLTISADTFILQPGPEGHDMFVRDRDGDDAGGYGHRILLEVGGWSDTYNSYIRFDLSEMPSYASSAVIKLYCFDYFEDQKWGPPPSISVHQVMGQWDEDSTHWSNQPPLFDLGIDLSALTEPGWYEIDITDLYNDWGMGTFENFGIALTPDQTDNRFALIYSSDFLVDESLRPKLIVESTSDPTVVLQDTVVELNSIDPLSFRNLNLQNSLTNKLMAAIQLIASGAYDEARSKLLNDVLRKTDGCINVGKPDKNDWIQDCPSQETIYHFIIEVVVSLESY